jgi:hypothetical protein
MADLPKDNESTLNPQRAEETHKPGARAAGGRHEAETQREARKRGDHSGDPDARGPERTGGRTARRRARRSGGRWRTP